MNSVIAAPRSRKPILPIPCLLVLTGLLLVVPVGAEVKQAGPEPEKKAEPAAADTDKTVEPGAVEVHFADGSVLKLKVLDERLAVTTPFGKLQIPIGEVHRVEFATRLSDDVAQRIDAAIANLASNEFPKRQAGSAELKKLKELAYPALLQAAAQKDPEVVRRAEAILEHLRESVPPERLVVRPFDVIHTAHSKIAGKIEGSTFKVHTTQFGDVPLRLSEMRSLRSLAVAPEVEVVNAVPDPGNLNGFSNQLGKTFAFTVTGMGQQNNAVWGTDVYTTDSQLATAAVHAGVLRPGQTGVVRIKIVQPPAGFLGSTRNGVTSHNYGMFGAAYQILK